MVSGPAGLFWELRARRDLVSEIWAISSVTESVRRAGIQQVAFFHEDEIRWGDLFKGTRELDVFLAYGETWRNSHDHQLRELARRPNARIRVILPNPENETAIRELAGRFSQGYEELKTRVLQAKEYFERLAEDLGPQATLMIWLFDGAPTFTAYRFDDIAMLSLYNHRYSRISVPAVIVHSQGSLYKFIRDEFLTLTSREPALTFPEKE